MGDVHTVTTTSTRSRGNGACGGFLAGLGLFLGSFALLFWNEGRAITTARSLEEGASAVQSASPDRIEPSHEGKLVHLTGKAQTTDRLADEEFGVEAAPALKLERHVELYQWRESKSTRTTHSGNTTRKETTYSYAKVWDRTVHNSGSFHDRSGHENPNSKRFADASWTASRITAGAYALTAPFVEKLDVLEPLPVQASRLPPRLATEVRPHGAGYYRGQDPASPRVGDLRISFKVLQPCEVSVIGRQSGGSLEPYQTVAGDVLCMLERGASSADAMFKGAQLENTVTTWLARAGGCFAMFLGMLLLSSPLQAVVGWIPLVRNVVGLGVFLFALGGSFVLSLTTIAVGWFAYRPLLAGALLVGAGVVAVGMLVTGGARGGTAAQIP